MQRAGVSRDNSEMVLDHALPAVEDVYDNDDSGDEKTEGLQKLAVLVDSIINPPPESVIQLDVRRWQRRRKAA